MIEFHFFWNANKNFRVAGNIRVGRLTGNTHIFLGGLITNHTQTVIGSVALGSLILKEIKFGVV